MWHSFTFLFHSASDGYLYLYNRMICDRTLKVLNICQQIVPLSPPPSLFPSHFPRVPPSLLPFLHPSPTPLSYTPLLLPPRTHRLMHIRMMLTQSRLQMKVLRSSSRVGMMGYARCGTGGPSLKHTVTLLVSWRDTRMELPSLTLRYACPHIHTLISSLNTVHVVMQIHTHTHALTHTSLI